MKYVKYMGYSVLIDDDDNLIQPENQKELIEILEKSILVDVHMQPNGDGSFTHTFNFEIGETAA